VQYIKQLCDIQVCDFISTFETPSSAFLFFILTFGVVLVIFMYCLNNLFNLAFF